MKGRVAGAVLALCLGVLAVPARAAVTARLSSSQVTPGSTVQLTLRYDGLTTSEPDLAPLRRNFDILGTSSSTSVQIGTGGTMDSTEVDLTLAPKHAGRLTIPPLAWDGQRSPALTLTVSGSSSAAAPDAGTTAPPAIFIVSHVTPAHPYVQSQVRLTVQIFTDEQLYHGTLDFSGHGAALVKQIGTDHYASTMRDGRPYQVITRRYVLFPLRSGTVHLAGPVLDGQVAVTQSASPWSGSFGSFFGQLVQSTRPIEVHGDPIVLSVRPRPPGQRSGYWLPARQVTLSAQWSPTTLRAQAGNPLTVTLHLRATGLTAGQLPNLTHLITPPAGLSTYPDQPRLRNTMQGGEMVGERDQTLAFIANRAGHYSLPPITIHWWDTRTNQARTASIPGRTLTVLAAPSGTPAAASPLGRVPAPAARSESPHPAASAGRAAPRNASASAALRRWQWVSAGLAALWLATIGAWLATGWVRRHRRAAPAPVERAVRLDPARARAAFRAACARNDPVAARHHLLLWASSAWNTPQTRLSTIARAISRPELTERLRELERACFGGGSWKGEALAQELTELASRSPPGHPRDEPLPPLYS
jgi:hypothetical protein